MNSLVPGPCPTPPPSEISSKSVHNFFSYLTHRQTDRTKNITSFNEGNKCVRCLDVDADTPFANSSTKLPHSQTTKTDSDRQRLTTVETPEWRRHNHRSDVRVNVDNTSIFDTALNDLVVLSTRNLSTSSGISSATSTTNFAQKVYSYELQQQTIDFSMFCTIFHSTIYTI